MLPVLLLVVGCALAGALWWVLNVPRAKSQPVLAGDACIRHGAGRGERPHRPQPLPQGGDRGSRPAAAARSWPRVRHAWHSASALPAGWTYPTPAGGDCCRG